MNAYANIDSQVLLATARVKAALEVVPRIVGSKEAWETWMRKGLQSEIKKVPKATLSSPWPRFLARVNTVLCLYYYSAMQINTFNIDEVQSDDSSIMGDEFVDLPSDALPDPTGDDLWWKVLPPSVSLKESTPSLLSQEPPAQNERSPFPTFPDELGTSSTGNDTRSQHKPRPKQKVQDQYHARAPWGGPISSGSMDTQTDVATACHTTKQASPRLQTRSMGTSGTTSKSPRAGPSDSVPVRNRKRSERAAQDVPERPAKKKKQSKSIEVSVSEKRNDVQPGPSTTSSHEGNEEVEDSRVCDACKTRSLTCLWPAAGESSTSRNEKRACTMCSLQKIRCTIPGVFTIRPPRGKRGESRPSPPQNKVDGLIQQVTQLSERITDLEKKRASNDQEKERLVTSVALLELQFSRLKKQGKS